MKQWIVAVCSTIIFLSIIQQSRAQMVGQDVYVKGQHLEFGIDGLGGFEGVDTAVSSLPLGMHQRSTDTTTLSVYYFGIVANPQRNAWAGSNFDGDFFAPGSAQNAWGFEIGTSGGDSAMNNCAYLQQINGAITSFTTTGNRFSVDWEADYSTATDLHFKINYSLYDTALFYTTTISITNNTATTIEDMYYFKNIDPDNNQSLSGNFETENEIVSQAIGDSVPAHVSASQSLPWKSYFALIGTGANWKASYGGFDNRDASAAWYGGPTPYGPYTQTVGARDTADRAILLAYRIQNLTPGSTETFHYITIADTGSIYAALNSLLFLDFRGEDNNSSFIPDTIINCGSDSVLINVSGPTANDYNWLWTPSIGLSDTTGISVSALPLTQTTYTVVGTPLSGTGNPDTMKIVVRPFPYSFVATLSSFTTTLCQNTTPLLLAGGNPFGGTYSGIGVYNDSVFYQDSVTAGSYLITYTVSDSNACFAQDTATIVVEDCTGLETNSLNNALSVYPNPFTDGATILIGNNVQLKNAKLFVYDILGKEVLCISGIQNHELKLERQNLKSGIYFFQLINDTEWIGNGKMMVK